MSNIQLRKQVAALIAEVEKTHRYSMSKIYDLSNEVFGKEEKPQSCSSCLIRKVRDLKNWLVAQETEKASDNEMLSPENEFYIQSRSDEAKPVAKRGRKKKAE